MSLGLRGLGLNRGLPQPVVAAPPPPPPPPSGTTNFHLFGSDVRFSQYNNYFRALDAVVTQETV